jgi:hypothetical protein
VGQEISEVVAGQVDERFVELPTNSTYFTKIDTLLDRQSLAENPWDAVVREVADDNSLVSYWVWDDLGVPLAANSWVGVTEIHSATRNANNTWSIGAVIDRIGPNGAGYTMVGTRRQLNDKYDVLTHNLNIVHLVYSQNATFNTIGSTTTTVTGSGTAQAAAQNSPRVNRLDSTSALGVQAANPLVCRGANTDVFAAGFHFTAVLRLPDASYNETGANTGTRIAVGLSSAGSIATVLNSDSLANSFIGFVRRHTNSGTKDTNWMLLARDGSNTSTVTTNVAFSVNQWLRFDMWLAAGSGQLNWQITNISTGVSTSGVWTMTNAPSVSTMLASFIGLVSEDATARNMDVLRMVLLS